MQIHEIHRNRRAMDPNRSGGNGGCSDGCPGTGENPPQHGNQHQREEQAATNPDNGRRQVDENCCLVHLQLIAGDKGATRPTAGRRSEP